MVELSFAAAQCHVGINLIVYIETVASISILSHQNQNFPWHQKENWFSV
jgi:hypothetical protein